MSQVITISFFRLSGLPNRFWAMSQMRFGHAKVKGTDGLTFYRLLGSGRGNGFDWRPEWSRYAFLGVWGTEQQATEFFSSNAFFVEYRERSEEVYTLFMKCVTSHGKWGGDEPFQQFPEKENGPIAVITRATIKSRFIFHFWRFVAPVASSLGAYPERKLSVGIGEWPVFMQATFSLWTNKKAMLDYAYKNPQHKGVVEMTRKLGWYKEELFARFSPYKSEGSWHGGDPFAQLGSPAQN